MVLPLGTPGMNLSRVSLSKSLPLSICCSRAVAVKLLVMEPIRIRAVEGQGFAGEPPILGDTERPGVVALGPVIGEMATPGLGVRLP